MPKGTQLVGGRVGVWTSEYVLLTTGVIYFLLLRAWAVWQGRILFTSADLYSDLNSVLGLPQHGCAEWGYPGTCLSVSLWGSHGGDTWATCMALCTWVSPSSCLLALLLFTTYLLLRQVSVSIRPRKNEGGGGWGWEGQGFGPRGTEFVVWCGVIFGSCAPGNLLQGTLSRSEIKPYSALLGFILQGSDLNIGVGGLNHLRVFSDGTALLPMTRRCCQLPPSALGRHWWL